MQVNEHFGSERNAESGVFGACHVYGHEGLHRMNKWVCAKCDVMLVPKNKIFSYMGNTFSHEVPRCPVCGRVFIPKELADGKMAKVEQMMEDK